MSEMTNKPKLIILEGFDRVGKDTLLRRLVDLKIGTPYIQIEDKSMPNYREDPMGFYNFLVKYLDNQVNDLIELSKTSSVIFLSRFFASDYVYSQIFHRPNIANEFKDKLYKNFEIENVIFLWKTYEDYNMRCMSSMSEIEYNKMEFDRIQQLYLEFAKENDKNTNVIFVEEKDSTTDIYNMFMNRDNFDHNRKIQAMFDLFFDLDKNNDLVKLKCLLKENKSLVDKGFIFAGVGKNWYICEKLNKTFLSMGLKSQALDPVHALHGDLGMVDGQIVFCISKSGTTEELVRFVKALRALKNMHIKDCILVGFCLNNKFENNGLYDYLIVPSGAYSKDKIYEFDEKNIVPTLSINIMQMVLDKFGVEIFESFPDLVENYKYNHLAGENGRRLGVDQFLKSITQ